MTLSFSATQTTNGVEPFRRYGRRNKVVSRRFMEAVLATLQAIGNDPSLGQRIYSDFRFRRVPGFPYLVYYSIEPVRIVVVAISHGRRRPKHWLRR